jgi:lipoate-protein ligase A
MSSGWRLLADVAPTHGTANMALDRALLESVADGAAPVVRFYRWSPATLSFGRNQPARGLYDEAAAARRGIGFVRRPTGGQAVLHDDELTYAVVAPVDVIGKPRTAYRRINEALVAGLGSLGLRVGQAGAAPLSTGGGEGRWLAACFRRPERGEVVVAGRKLVGSAQRTESRTILQHGSILLGGSQAVAEELLIGGDEAPPRAAGAGDEGWTTVEAELGRRPGPEELMGALVPGFERVLGARLAPAEPSPGEAEAARRLEERFASPAWTWRR